MSERLGDMSADALIGLSYRPCLSGVSPMSAMVE